jgi:hypothetical protein
MINSDFRSAVEEDQRLLILQTLVSSPDYTAHEHLLRQALSEEGQRLSADAMRVQLAWLDEQGLLTDLGQRVRIARLTQRGEDVASGSARCPGVARPRP